MVQRTKPDKVEIPWDDLHTVGAAAVALLSAAESSSETAARAEAARFLGDYFAAARVPVDGSAGKANYPPAAGTTPADPGAGG